MIQQQDPDQTRNTILAVVLCIGILIAWQLLYLGPKMEAERARLQQEQQRQEQVATDPAAGPGAATGPVAPGQQATAGPIAPAIPGVAVSREAALEATAAQRVAIETPSIIGSVNRMGARIDDITLVKYHVEVDPKSPRVVIYSPVNAPNPYFAEFNWRAPAGSDIQLPGPNTLWNVESGGPLAPGNPIVLTWQNEKNVSFRRQISVDENYMFTVRDTVQNNSGEPLTLFPSGAIFRYGIPQIEGFFIQHEGLIGVVGEAGLEEITYHSAMESGGGAVYQNAVGGWVGFTDKYWGSALIPSQTVPYNASLGALTPETAPPNAQQFAASYAAQAVTVPAQGETSTEQRLYVGAKKVELIQAYETDLGIKQFELMIDWGWFYFITKPLHALLNWLYGLLGNFGYAILAVTIIVKAAFFWFANKSYESMAKMKKLQPEMEKIRTRYKDDKMEQQKALMELYRNEKINPLAGCLPILIQIPVFFALYKVLFISIDMRHAPFIGWINDLSAPDPTTIWNLFGLLPFEPWAWLPLLGLWPLFMGVTMWLQMQLNPQQPDPIQQQVFNWLPVLFTFLLASFPAGLVIYWAWNNVLSLMQQYVIMKRQGVDIPLMDNLRRTASAAVALPSKLFSWGSKSGS